MENELRIYQAYFKRGKDPRKIYLHIPYNSRSLLIDGMFEEELKPGCFTKSLRSGLDVKSFWNHNSGMVLGSTKAGTMKIRDTEKGLDISLDPPNNSWGRDALESINRGDTDGCSFGFSPNIAEFNDDGSVRYIIQADLWEISPTAMPAYPKSKAFARSQNTTKQNEKDLREYFSGREKKMKKNYAKVDKIFSRNPWDSNHEFLRAVINATSLTEPEDIRLTRATGLGEAHQSEGGFLTKKELIDTWLYGETSSDLYRRCFKVPVGEGIFRVEIPMINETGRADGDHMGGLQLYYEDEADSVEISTPGFRSNKTSLKKLIGLCPVTDELMQDGPRMERLLSNIFGQKLRYSIDDAILNGTGSGRPLGLKYAPATLTIQKESGQDASTVVSENILKMVAALPAECFGSACWIVNPELLEQLYKLNVEVGTGGSALALWQWKSSGELYNKLAGFDCIPNEHCSAPGQTGDIYLADLSRYAVFEKQVKETISSHLYFLTDESAFRLIYRFDAQPLWNAPIVPKNGSSGAKISPFIKLQVRS